MIGANSSRVSSIAPFYTIFIPSDTATPQPAHIHHNNLPAGAYFCGSSSSSRIFTAMSTCTIPKGLRRSKPRNGVPISSKTTSKLMSTALTFSNTRTPATFWGGIFITKCHRLSRFERFSPTVANSPSFVLPNVCFVLMLRLDRRSRRSTPRLGLLRLESEGQTITEHTSTRSGHWVTSSDREETNWTESAQPEAAELKHWWRGECDPDLGW